MEDLDLGKEMQELVETVAGNEVSIHTGECVIWKVEHKNCVGCPT